MDADWLIIRVQVTWMMIG